MSNSDYVDQTGTFPKHDEDRKPVQDRSPCAVI